MISGIKYLLKYTLNNSTLANTNIISVLISLLEYNFSLKIVQN